MSDGNWGDDAATRREGAEERRRESYKPPPPSHDCLRCVYFDSCLDPYTYRCDSFDDGYDPSNDGVDKLYDQSWEDDNP